MIADFLSGEDTETFKKLSSEYSMHAAITLLLIPHEEQWFPTTAGDHEGSPKYQI